MRNLNTILKIILLMLNLCVLSQGYAQNAKFDSLFNELDRTAIFKKTKSLEILDIMYQMAHSAPDSSLLIAYCLYEEAFLNFQQGIVDTILTVRIRKRLEDKHLSPLKQALLQSALGRSLTLEGEYTEAFPLQLQSLETFKQLKNNRLIVKTLHELGNICRFINLLSLAEYYYSEAIAYITPKSFEYCATKTDIYTLRFITNQNDHTMVDSLFVLLKIAKKENYKELLPFLYFSIGACYYETDPDKALFFFTKRLSMNIDNPKSTSALYGNLGYYYLSKKDYKKALSYFRYAQEIMEAINDFHNLPTLYNDLAFIFEQQNRYDSTLYYIKKSQELILKTHSHLVAIETHQKYINTFLEVQKNELTIAEQTIKLKNKQFTIIVIISVSIVLVILLLLFIVRQQKLRKTSENRELTAKLEHEKRVQQYEKRQRKLEKEQQEALLDAKTREIATYSLLVSNKNFLLKQIMNLNSQISDNKDNVGKMAAKIDDIIQSNLNIDEEWETFKMHFDKVHPHFFEKLKQYCSDLTEENLKMCAYFKMKMTTKQVAQLFHVYPRSIVISRYRLKKKLHLSEDEDLETFIAEL